MAFDQAHHDQNLFPPPVQFQIPSFVCSVAPTLAPGGGAEVLPVSLLSDNQIANTWFSNNGFAPRSFSDQYQQQDRQDEDSPHTASPYAPPARQQQHSLSAPFEFDSYITPSSQSPPEVQPLRTLTQAELSAFIQPQSNPSVLLHQPSSDLPAPSSLGLPVYSASGFDLLSILARVTSRPHPRVILGPVDLTCSFVVVDVRRFDHPIVYCSPTFCRLTGYSENEILGRNCRFLQAPNGQVQRGEPRHFTDQSAVAHLRKNLSADKECQTSIVNYRKDGTAFINLVTVIPILGGVFGLPHEEPDVVYHVGFQVDLTEQPNAILEKLRDGSYIVDYGAHRNQLPQPPPLGSHNVGHLKDRKSQVIPSVRISRELKKLLADPAFIKSIPITTSTTAPPSQPSSSVRADTDAPSSVTGSNQLLHLLLLEASPDFIHVVSLKGSFLYVAPSVRRVLGYEPEEMLGSSIADYAHPEDVVPLMRELKEGSATGLAAVSMASTDEGGGVNAAADQIATGMQMAPRSVDLLFRARTKAGVYVWIECKGRLHVEPGKGRKAIILSGRAKEMPKLEWHRVAAGGGLSLPVPTFGGSVKEGGSGGGGSGRRMSEMEVWGTMSSGQGAGGVVSFLTVGAGVHDVLGWTPSDLVGREVVKYIVEGLHQFGEELRLLRSWESLSNPRRFCCKMRHKNGSTVDVVFILYRPTNDSSATKSIPGITPAPLIYQIRSRQSFKPLASSSASLVHSLNSDVFEELDTNRDSSWQYEIQQIRFANQRLEDEIAVLTKQLEEAEDVQQKVYEDLQRPSTRENVLDQYVSSTTNSSPPLHQSPSPLNFGYTGCQQPYPTQHHDQAPSSSSSSSSLVQSLSTPIHSQHYSNTVPGTYSSQPVTLSPLASFSRDWDTSAFVQNQPLRLPNLKRSWDSALR
ncbi:hypothetical protein D9756_010926 [Leucocoprinus leucothites]|uniref:PAS domain-containing protein n=1 Tax=Leucocoprinus leucothites TaxID=201217 RepID=A0A8H5CQ84_9AGAR|nr:hypothetical protein D9756_010926 [Leucoagaricus leucothites]